LRERQTSEMRKRESISNKFYIFKLSEIRKSLIQWMQK
jgi:hypothetical protein